MWKSLIVIALVLLGATSADARQRRYLAHPDCNVLWPCEGVKPSARGERIAKAVGFGAAIKYYTPAIQPRRAHVARQHRSERHHVRVVRREAPMQPVSRHMNPSKSLDGVVPILADKVRDIVTTCGSQIWSTVRHTFIAGTRTISLHASGQAVDVHGNPSCIYAMLKGWPGGYSTDYSRVNHVHISYGGREQGARFAHGGGHRHHYARRHHNTRYARRHHNVRYARRTIVMQAR